MKNFKQWDAATNAEFRRTMRVLVGGFIFCVGLAVGTSARAAPLVEWVQTVDGSDCTVTATPQQQLSSLEFYICPNGTGDEDCIAYGTVVSSASCGTDPLTSTYDCSSGFRVYQPSQTVCKEGVDYDHADSPEGFNWSNGSPDTFSYTTDDTDGALVCGGVDDCPVPEPEPTTPGDVETTVHKLLIGIAPVACIIMFLVGAYGWPFRKVRH